jgi:retron-type reverse transcriptase
MRRQRIELLELAAWDNLLHATWKAARGKRGRSDVAEFLDDLDQRLARLGDAILSARAPVGRYRAFRIRDPKPRLIHAACFEDRVLHHAILNLAEPVFERSLVPSTYACRPGKGVHRAVAHVQESLRRYPWFVQVDIDGYFPAIAHDRLRDRLDRRFKGRDFLDLLDRIIDAYHATPGHGLPIGSLTSQHFANLYLDGADRFLRAHPLVRDHVRYMDDIIWWCAERTAATATLAELRDYLGDHCGLSLKPAARLNRSDQGTRYCGYRVLPGCLRLGPRAQRRYRARRRFWEAAWQVGAIDDRALQSAYDAVLATTCHAASRSWRRLDLQLHPSRYDDDDGWRS